MKKFVNSVKKVFDAIAAIIVGIGILSVVIAWIVSFISITYGLALWSTQWLASLI